MGNSSKRDTRTLETLAMRQRIVELRKSGLSLRDIAEEVGLSHPAVHRHMAIAIALANEKLASSADDYRKLDAEGIADDLERTEYDLGRIEARLELLDQTERYAPTDTEAMADWSPEEIALAKLGISEPATNILAKLIDARTKLIAKRTDLRARRAKMFGVDASEKHEITGKDGGAIVHMDMSKLSDAELEAVVRGEPVGGTEGKG